MRSSRVANVLLSLMVVVVVLGGLEGAMRLLGLGRDKQVAEYIANWTVQWHDDFYYVMSGDHITADGVRDVPHTVDNPAGRKRVVFLGDSVTFGFPLSYDDSFPALLQNMLDARGVDLEVFNVALLGWSTRQEHIAYERIVRKYRPDLVVVGICLNDVAEMQNNLAKPAPLLALAFEYSRLVRWLFSARDWEVHRVEQLFSEPDSLRVRNGWELTFAELRALAGDVRRDGGRFALIVFPFRRQVEPRAPEPIPQRLLHDLAAGEGWPILDALPLLAPLGDDGFVDVDHLSRRGAEEVAAGILASGILGQP